MLRFTYIAIVLLLVAPAAGAGGEAPDFDRDIRPIFEQHCYECHGATKAEGGLRLTSRAAAFTPGDYGIEVLVPGDASLSLLYERLIDPDPAERMPHKRDPLAPGEIDRLRRWIDAGVEWPEHAARHWAYVAPVRPAVPGPGHPVDAYVQARLDQEGVEAQPRAQPARLLRRLHLDVVGLPPTPQEVASFVADPSSEHYEAIVDGLLASPRFGERWAVPWLDAARYSDSNGFQKDNFRHTWGYRDWVIDALNADMPFDQFTIEQLAGDLLAEPTTAQRVATGFNRSATVNIEVGVDPEEDRIRQVGDRLNTTAMVWLGASLECAQCHDHRFDPYTQREYYELFAFFNSSESDVVRIGNKGVAYNLAGPRVDLPNTPTRQRQLDRLNEEARAARARLGAVDRAAAFPSWVEEMRRLLQSPVEWVPVEVLEVRSSAGEHHDIAADGSISLEGPVPDTVEHTIDFTSALDSVTSVRIQSLGAAAGGASGEHRPKRGLPMLSEVRLSRPGADGRGRSEDISIWINQPPTDKALAYLWLTVDGDPTSPWRMRGAPIYHFDTVPGGARLRLSLSQNYGFGRTLDRLRIAVTGAPHEQLVLPSRVQELLLDDDRTAAERAELFKYFGTRGLEAPSELQLLRQRATGLRPPTSLVMAELPDRRQSNVLLRGSHLSPGDPVEPSTPANLHAMADGLPRNRLGLARWLVDPTNPLVARVTVNRWWAAVFGAGLVRTPEEFGTRGARPTHRELLDWLAVEFVEGGWSMKHILRLLLTSEAYQRSSIADDELRRRDPENLLLARQSRRRLDAEFIRDNALSVSGLLVHGGQGRPKYPPQPDGLWTHVGSSADEYQVSWDDDRFRRGVYTVHRRSAPYPSFVHFDGPDRTTCTVQRSHTTTPLQALTLLNDEAWVEITLALAARLLSEPDALSERDRLGSGIQLVLAREARPKEIDVLAALLEAERVRLAADPTAAAALIASAEGYAAPENLDAVELGAWFSVASALINLDETITRS